MPLSDRVLMNYSDVSGLLSGDFLGMIRFESLAA
jgi:hypothetical protein